MREKRAKKMQKGGMKMWQVGDKEREREIGIKRGREREREWRSL